MTDRELLEAAAKAAGLPYIKPLPEYSGSLGLEVGSNPMRTQTWNPLTDDGDALRLAVKLSLRVDVGWSRQTDVEWMLPDGGDGEVAEPFDGDPYAATRRAIVRAAAALANA